MKLPAPAAHGGDQLFDMGNRRKLADPVAEVENMRTACETFENSNRLAVQLFPPGQQQQGIDIALDLSLIHI